MESSLERTIRQFLKDNAPALYAHLAQNGDLDHFIYYRAAAISSRVDEQRRRERWDFLPHLEFVARISAARAVATESILGDVVEGEVLH